MRLCLHFYMKCAIVRKYPEVSLLTDEPPEGLGYGPTIRGTHDLSITISTPSQGGCMRCSNITARTMRDHCEYLKHEPNVDTSTGTPTSANSLVASC